MCKEGWCIGLEQEGVGWGWGELSKVLQKGKYLQLIFLTNFYKNLLQCLT